MEQKKESQLFDLWPETYDRWFTTPIGALVRRYEVRLLLDLLEPGRGDIILDAGCGTGVFTDDFLRSGCRIVGIDLSLPMLRRGREKLKGLLFHPAVADMTHLPMRGGSFDKTVSVTALEFAEEGERAVRELFRVTRRGGVVVVATLNRLSPWASRRKARGHAIFDQAIFRSPEELLALAPEAGAVETAIHFKKDDDPEKAPRIEEEGRRKELKTGAFVVARWVKP